MRDAAEHILHRVVTRKRAGNRDHNVDGEQFPLLQHLTRCDAFQHKVGDNTDEHDENGLDK